MSKRIDETIPKRCGYCGIEYPPENFYRCQPRPDGTRGLSTNCKCCTRKINKSQYHSLSKEDKSKKFARQNIINRIWKSTIKGRMLHCLAQSRKAAKEKHYLPCNATADKLIKSFTGLCHVCGTPEKELTRKLHLDHDHVTGEFRGWLCNKCNAAAGMLHESPDLILRLALYVEQGGLAQ